MGPRRCPALTRGNPMDRNRHEGTGAAADLANVRTNLGLVLSGDVEVVKACLENLAAYVKENPGLRAIFREISGDHLWIRKGESEFAPGEVA